MNFTKQMNKVIYEKYLKYPALAIGEQNIDDNGNITFIDLKHSDWELDLNKLTSLDWLKNHFSNKNYFKHIRIGELLEHLEYDAELLKICRDFLDDAGTLLITVPYYGIAPYHLRLHNKWSITQLLNYAGFEIKEYIPRKAPKFDRLIFFIRNILSIIGIPKTLTNDIFIRLNKYLPIKPNGGYFICTKGNFLPLTEINKKEFT